MIEIIVGTDRPNSNTGKIARIVHDLYKAEGITTGLIDLCDLDYKDIAGGDYFKGAKGGFVDAVNRVTQASGIVLVVPEYNGSYPGALKLFIDYWKYPQTFENRPFAFIGLGGIWGGMRPVEHLQQVMGFRNGYCFPQRVFINNIKDTFKDGKITNPTITDLLLKQTRDFSKFVKGLQSQNLDARSKLLQA